MKVQKVIPVINLWAYTEGGLVFNIFWWSLYVRAIFKALPDLVIRLVSYKAYVCSSGPLFTECVPLGLGVSLYNDSFCTSKYTNNLIHIIGLTHTILPHWWLYSFRTLTSLLVTSIIIELFDAIGQLETRWLPNRLFNDQSEKW